LVKPINRGGADADSIEYTIRQRALDALTHEEGEHRGWARTCVARKLKTSVNGIR